MGTKGRQKNRGRESEMSYSRSPNCTLARGQVPTDWPHLSQVCSASDYSIEHIEGVLEKGTNGPVHEEAVERRSS